MSGRRRENASRSAHRTAALLAPLLALLSTPGCGSTLYSWGPYENSVLVTEQDFRDEALLDEIDALEDYLAELREHDRLAPPGVHAHVGYLQYLAGNSDAAARHFEQEKAIYPESTVFIDGLLRRMN